MINHNKLIVRKVSSKSKVFRVLKNSANVRYNNESQ